jgi:L-2-hydroxyglutarate oxidase LhgO
MDQVQCIVVGAGVVGLAVARALAVSGHEVMVLEQADAIGTETSARNSEVIHAGIYYPQKSLKAQLCVRGRELLYAYAKARGIAHQQCGKLIVSTAHQQDAALQGLLQASLANGVDAGEPEHALRWLGESEARALEQDLACTAALLSPRTGTIDSHGLMLALQGDLEAAGGMVVLGTRVARIELHANRTHQVHTVGADGELELGSSLIVNAAGLHAVALAQTMSGLAPGHIPCAWYAKGNYFRYSGKPPFRHLIYPVPEPGGLGTHLTLDLAGRGRFGPDVQWLAQGSIPAQFDYRVDESRRDAFASAVRRYWPGMNPDRLVPDTSGIRPKISGPGQPAADFRIDGPLHHGVPGLVNLFGIESPGLTASLAIAELVVQYAHQKR